MSLEDYRTLGRSGLLVSPLALGTMTFGTGRWGTSEAASRAVFDAYSSTRPTSTRAGARRRWSAGSSRSGPCATGR